MRRPALMGIVNITPDSFSGDGQLPAQAVQRALELVEQGADIIDFGAESTRPGASPLTADEEWSRLGPVLEWVSAKDIRTRARISIDSYHAPTVARALYSGIDIVNDVSGLDDTAMMDILSEVDCDVVVMHSLGVPADGAVTLPAECDVLAEVLTWKTAVTHKAAGRGVTKERLIYDPGIGFGKTAEQSLVLMNAAAQLKASGGRWLYGHSRKSFMKIVGAEEMPARDAMTLQFSAQLAEAKIDYLRVHDVLAHTAMFERLCT